MSVSFGVPPTPGPQSTSRFNFQTPGTTAFPAASSAFPAASSAFGQSPFGVATTGAAPSLLGAPQAGFGVSAPASGALFGAAPAATTSIFGGTTASPFGGSLLGAAPAAGGLFGAQPAAGGLFGAQPAAGGLFGAAPAAGGLIGTQPAPGGLFGAAPGVGAMPSMFGGGAPAFGGAPTSSLLGAGGLGATSTTLFGTAVQPAGLGPGLGVGQSSAPVGGMPSASGGVRAFNGIFMAYNPTSPYCRFRAMFYNAVEKGTAPFRQRPAHVDERLWEQATLLNESPESLAPVQATGFEDLLQRLQAQKERIELHEKTLASLEGQLSAMASHGELETRVRLEQHWQKHAELTHRILRIMRKLEVLQHHGVPLSADEGALRARLERLQAELHKPNQFKSRLAELASLVQVNSERRTTAGATVLADPDQQSTVYGYLDGMRAALGALRTTLMKDLRDVAIMERGIAQDTIR